MTATGQDFTVYASTDNSPIFTVYSESTNTTPLDISTVSEITFTLQRDLDSSVLLTKTKSASGGITFYTDGTDGKFKVALTAANLASLSGYYIYQATVTDSSGNVSVVSEGRLRVARQPLWSYSGDPSYSDKDAVRMHIGDTDSSDQQMTDQEINYILTLYPQPLRAAAIAARRLGAKYARKVNKRVGDLSIDYSQIAKNYSTMADELEAQANMTGDLLPYAGGISVSDKDTVNLDTDRPRPNFSIGGMDNPSGPLAQVNDDAWR